jgi:dsDNA-specific endonuclease/ATPase MutS2
MSDEPDPIEFEINGELDLHTFRPSEVGELVPDYIGLCLEKGITRVRIIHGKGIGTLRETVHALLKKDPRVVEYHLAGPSEGAWGATIVGLRPQSSSESESEE